MHCKSINDFYDREIQKWFLSQNDHFHDNSINSVFYIQTKPPKMKTIVELALDCHCELGEGPIYDQRNSTLYFVDISQQTIHSFNTEEETHHSLELDEPIGAVALTSNPDLLLAATRRSVLLVRFWDGPDDHRGVVRTLAETPEAHGVDGMRFNDGKVAPNGAFVLGRMHNAWREPGNRGRLYSLDPGASSLREILTPEHVGLPNGMAWKDQTFYFVDSAEESISTYEIDEFGAPRPETANVISQNATGHKRVPDGMTLDSNGNIWVAYGESGSVAQLDGTTGKELQRVKLPVKRPTSCGFGGAGLEWLYVTTRVESDDQASKHHGGLFRVQIEGVKGAAPDAMYTL